MKKLAILVLLLLASCHEDTTSPTVVDEDATSDLVEAKSDLQRAEVARTELPLKQRGFARALEIMGESLQCNDDKCCEHFAHAERDAQIATADALASWDPHALPSALRKEGDALGSAIVRLGDEVRNAATTETIATCREIREHVAALAKNQAAWTEAGNDLDDRVAKARAAVADANKRVANRAKR